MSNSNSCKNCGVRHKLLGKTGECFKCNMEEWYKAYPSKQSGEGKNEKASK